MSTILAVAARACAAFFALAAFAAAAADDPIASSTAAPQNTPVPLNSGVTPEEFPADVSKVTLERRPDGTRLYHLNGQGMQSVRVQIGPDGKLEYSCNEDNDDAAPPQNAEAAHER